MCGENITNLEDGSSSCPVALVPGASPSYRYAVIVSFGVLLNGTALDDIASKVSPPDLSLWCIYCCSAMAHCLKLDVCEALDPGSSFGLLFAYIDDACQRMPVWCICDGKFVTAARGGL